MPGNESRAEAQLPGSTTQLTYYSPNVLQLTAQQRRRVLPVASGELFSPCGRRRLWSLIVRRCPNCSHLHIHRLGNPAADTFIRTGSCGAAYKVTVARGAEVAA